MIITYKSNYKTTTTLQQKCTEMKAAVCTNCLRACWFECLCGRVIFLLPMCFRDFFIDNKTKLGIERVQACTR